MKSGTLACVRCVNLHNIYLCKCQPYKMVKHNETIRRQQPKKQNWKKSWKVEQASIQNACKSFLIFNF